MTETEIKQIYTLWEQHNSVTAIANMTGFDEAAVKAVLEKKYYLHSANGMRTTKPNFPVDEIRELAKTKTTAEIAEYCGLPYAVTCYHLKKHGIRPLRAKTGPKDPRSRMSDKTKAVIEDIKNANGATLEEIGKRYGISRQRVYQIKKFLEQQQQ